MSLLWPVKVYGYCVSGKFICTALFIRPGYRLISQVALRVCIGSLLFCFACFVLSNRLLCCSLQHQAGTITVEVFLRRIWFCSAMLHSLGAGQVNTL